MGAAIFKHGKLVSLGCNIQKTHPKFPELYSVHAEIKAILSAQSALDGCDIYIYRETKKGDIAMAKPCPVCLQTIIEAKIHRVFYTVPDGFATLVL